MSCRGISQFDFIILTVFRTYNISFIKEDRRTQADSCPFSVCEGKGFDVCPEVVGKVECIPTEF